MNIEKRLNELEKKVNVLMDYMQILMRSQIEKDLQAFQNTVNESIMDK